MIDTATRYALRSLARNQRRTLLSVLGLAFGVGIGLVALSWIGGQEPMTISALANGGMGHLRIVPVGWNTHRDDGMRLEDGENELARVRAMPGVVVATPRTHVGGLLGIGTRSTHVTLTGVDPETEPRATRWVRTVSEGRYLNAGETGAIVIGRTVADRLRARLDDELEVSVVVDHGEIQSALLVVVGIVSTGSRAIDASIAQVSLADVAQLSGRDGLAEIAILIDDTSAIDAFRTRVAANLPARDEALTWLELSPEFRNRIQSGQVFTRLAIAIVLLVVLLGVASAQLTSVLERRKELAVLAAIGMKARTMIRVVVTEGVIVGGVGALAAMAWSLPILHGWATNGVDMSGLYQSRTGIAYGGVLIDPMYYPAFGLWLAFAAFALSLVATTFASLYPAWFASRTDPASALRVDR